MKKTNLLISALLIFASTKATAQIWGVGGTNTFTPDKVAIGTPGPLVGDAALHVYGEEVSVPCTSGTTLHNPRPVLWLEQPTCWGCYATCPPVPSANIFQVSQAIYGPGGGFSNIVDVINKDGWVGVLQPTPSAPLDVNGNAFIKQKLTVGDKVVIGTNTAPSLSTPSGYSLYVAKGILTEKLKVAVHTDPANWADFVFDSNYNLMPLKEVESYINANQHLPEVPSADQVFNDGIDVAAMDAKLLQKIEELTLYAIQQQKQIEDLKKEIKSLKTTN